jgi:hypothetical protein
MSRAQFIERMKSPFLVAFIEGRPAQEFHTRVATKNSAPPRAVEIFACVKAPGNPYLDRAGRQLRHRAARCVAFREQLGIAPLVVAFVGGIVFTLFCVFVVTTLRMRRHLPMRRAQPA